MTLRMVTSATLCAVSLLGCGDHASSDAEHEVHWSYAGANGPAAWSSLDRSFTQCASGVRQSPIDLAVSTPEATDADVRASYGPSRVSIANTGHTIQATFEDGDTLQWGDQHYQLIQLHYHRPSEHTFNGKAADLEVHLVHRGVNGELAVLGVLFDVGNTSDSVVAALIRGGTEQDAEPAVATIDPSTLVPRERSYFSYDGSLTTPPCSEAVRWIVLHARESVSADQLAQLDRILGSNARPVMPLAGRSVLVRRNEPR